MNALLLLLLLIPQTVQDIGQPIVYVTIQPGSDFCSELADALGQAGYKNAYIDARGFYSVQACDSNPFTGLSGTDSNLVVLLPCVIVNTTVPWAIPVTNDVDVRMCGRQGNGTLRATTGFPANSALLTVGVSGSKVSSVMVENGRIDCSGANNPGCVPYISYGLNEHSGLQHMVLVGENSSTATGPCAFIGDTNQSGLPGHYTFYDVDLSKCGANDSLLVSADGADMGHINRITCNNTGLVTGLACVHFVDNFGSSHSLEGVATEVHAEGVTDSVFFDAASFGSARDIDGTGVVSNILHVDTTFAVEADDLYSTNPSAMTVKNDNAACSGSCSIAASVNNRIMRYTQQTQNAGVNTATAQ